MLLSDSRGNYHLKKRCCGWHILCNLLSLRGALWRISLHLRDAVCNYAQFCKPIHFWQALSCCFSCWHLACWGLPELLWWTGSACQGDVSRKDLGEEGMMHMLVLWDEIVSLGAVVPGCFVPFTKIKAERRCGTQNTVKSQVSHPGADPQQRGISNSLTRVPSFISELTLSPVKEPKVLHGACKRSRNAGISRPDWAKGLSKPGSWARCKPVPDVLQNASTLDIFHTSFLPHSHQLHGWSHSIPCCVSSSCSLPACSPWGRVVEGSQWTHRASIPALRGGSCLTHVLRSMWGSFLEQRLFPCLSDRFREAKKWLAGKVCNSGKTLKTSVR